ncbi:glutaredoxin family protein [Herbaspirillum chlorophenolicum]|uniref:Glutaredoxin family protein n=1 Tax=Herbaspirillum chlorophenolicum TaxID=211589 RepID=A0ABW8EUT2_9BURK
MADTLRFVIYSRSYCHLCDDLRQALLARLDGRAADIEMVDVDADPALVERYDELVPVLMAQQRDGEWLQLCHYFLDESGLQVFIDGVDGQGAGAR